MRFNAIIQPTELIWEKLQYVFTSTSWNWWTPTSMPEMRIKYDFYFSAMEISLCICFVNAEIHFPIGLFSRNKLFPLLIDFLFLSPSS